jgi:DNA-nicking Smr family endonuclease
MRTARKRKQQPEPQAKLDLHGFTVEVAYGQVSSMINRWREREYTLVEIVTGKSGLIRYEAPFWFENLGVRAQVSKHGGSFYVYL